VNNVSEERMGAHADLHSHGQTTRFTTHFTLTGRPYEYDCRRQGVSHSISNGQKGPCDFLLLDSSHFAGRDAH
jgi:hypothetical protein